MVDDAKLHQFMDSSPIWPNDCETASNRDPLPKQHNALITDAEFDQRGVPIPAVDNRLAVEAQIRSLLSDPLRLGMQPSLTLYWL